MIRKFFDRDWLAENRKKGKRVVYYDYFNSERFKTYSGWATYIDTVKFGPFSGAIILVPQCRGEINIKINKKYYAKLPSGFRIAGGQQLSLADPNNSNWQEIDNLLNELLPTAQSIWSLFIKVHEFQSSDALSGLKDYARQLKRLGEESEIDDRQMESLITSDELIGQPFFDWEEKVRECAKQLDLIGLRSKYGNIRELADRVTIEQRNYLNMLVAYQKQENQL